MKFVLLPVIALTIGCTSSTPNTYNAANLEIDKQQVDFVAEPGIPTEATVVLSNTGELALGIESVSLEYGEEAFRLSDFDDNSTDTGSSSDEPFLVVLQPGETFPFAVEFAPVNLGLHSGVIRVSTASDPDNTTAAIDGIWADPDRAEQRVYLYGEATGQIPSVLPYLPGEMDMGWVHDTQSTSAIIRNFGNTPFQVTGLWLEDCSDGFTIDSAPSLPFSVDNTSVGEVQIRYEPINSSHAQCTLTFVTDVETMPNLQMVIRANDAACPDRSPSVMIHEPTNGASIFSSDTAEVVLSINDNEPISALHCSISSKVLLGYSLGGCTMTSEEGLLTTHIDMSAYGSLTGPDVLRVSVSDSCGHVTRANTPVLIRVGPSESDIDGDGFTTDHLEFPDCDDGNASTFHFATELPDGEDNDCDGIIDEETDKYDDDGDGQTEEDGDCDDLDKDTYTGAVELTDNRDNDCDDLVDEGTANFDDDGDGYSEQQGDCNDSDITISPVVNEICDDGIDNNCNTIKDYLEPCELSGDSSEFLGLEASRTTVAVGQSVHFQAHTAGGELTHSWEADSGTVQNLDQKVIVWQAPSTVPDSGQAVVIYRALSPNGNLEALARQEITILEEAQYEALLQLEGEPISTGCQTSTFHPSRLFPFGLALVCIALWMRSSPTCPSPAPVGPHRGLVLRHTGEPTDAHLRSAEKSESPPSMC